MAGACTEAGGLSLRSAEEERCCPSWSERPTSLDGGEKVVLVWRALAHALTFTAFCVAATFRVIHGYGERTGRRCGASFTGDPLEDAPRRPKSQRSIFALTSSAPPPRTGRYNSHVVDASFSFFLRWTCFVFAPHTDTHARTHTNAPTMSNFSVRSGGASEERRREILGGSSPSAAASRSWTWTRRRRDFRRETLRKRAGPLWGFRKQASQQNLKSVRRNEKKNEITLRGRQRVHQMATREVGVFLLCVPGWRHNHVH